MSKAKSFSSTVFLAFSNFIISGCRLIELPRVVITDDFEAFPSFFIYFNNSSNFLTVSPSSPSLLSPSSLLSITLFIWSLKVLHWYCATLVCASNYLPEYSNLFNAAVFSSKYFSGKTSLSFKNSYLLTFPDDKADILAVFCLNYIELYFARFCYRVCSLTNTHLQ